MWQAIVEQTNISNGIGVLGILIGFYLYAKAKPYESLTYIVAETSIISVDRQKYGEKLEVMFDGKVVPRVTAARLLLWNTGNSSVEPNDFLKKAPLHIVGADGVHILSHTIIATETPENVTELITVQGENGEQAALRMHFDVIRPREGFLCEILHTGAKGQLKAGGLLRRSSKGVVRTTSFMDGSSLFEARSKLARFFFPLFLAIVMAALIAGFGFLAYLVASIIALLLENYISEIILEKLGGRYNIQFYTVVSATVIFSLWLVNDSWCSWTSRPSKKLRDAYAQTS